MPNNETLTKMQRAALRAFADGGYLNGSWHPTAHIRNAEDVVVCSVANCVIDRLEEMGFLEQPSGAYIPSIHITEAGRKALGE